MKELLEDMDGDWNNKKVVCCFCGKPLLLRDAVVLIVQPRVDIDERQSLFCHKSHFLDKIHESIVLHPDFFLDDYEDN